MKDIRYKLITGSDPYELTERVNNEFDEGYQLYGSPIVSEVDGAAVYAQGLVIQD
jgi:hypothetical protein